MLKKRSTRLIMLAALSVTFITSCKKEGELIAPTPGETGGENKMMIYIRAIEKDSSVVESEQILLN